MDELCVGGRRFRIFNLRRLAGAERLPWSLKILLENLLRNEGRGGVSRAHVEAILAAGGGPSEVEIPFFPSRVLLQDFTGVPCLVDLAAMREAARRRGMDPARMNPQIPVDLVIDHSVQVDAYGTRDAARINVSREYERNGERYTFLRWAQGALKNLRVVPPGTGIVHQVNLEFLASVVTERGGEAFFDTVVGTDSHTTMINGIGVLGWGVGGIEAEAAMLGQPMSMVIPEVVGVRLEGRLREGVMATDAVLTITESLRKKGVVGKLVEFFGPGLSALSPADRATIANMCPEYGATVAYFPVDQETLDFLRLTGRDEGHVEFVEAYLRAQGLFRQPDTPDPFFHDVVSMDLGKVEPSLAGPRRPQDRVALGEVKTSFLKLLTVPADKNGFGLSTDQVNRRMEIDGLNLRHGSVVIAAITSCTNTSNPASMLAAGILARHAVERGLRPQPWVKTSLAPGSRVVVDYLERARLLQPLEALGFHLVGFGCTTCIGNSGPLPDRVERAIREGELVAVSVLSGNRNFEGRVHGSVRANYLASPPLVVAYALAGRIDIDWQTEPVGWDRENRPVFLRDLWPSSEEIALTLQEAVRPEMYRDRYSRVFDGDDAWRGLPVPQGDLFEWNEKSTYIRRPPYFDGSPREWTDIRGARALAVLGDSITTDHISPAGEFAAETPAGRYLVERGVRPEEFNSYGSRRGNHEVMMRGTFANVRLRNRLVPGREGGLTVHIPSGEIMTIFDAAERYRREGIPLIVIAGKEYGSGSSRDWAAKGPMLLGVRAVLAEGFERIHRTNLVGMGILPLQFLSGQNAASLGLTGWESFDIEGPLECRGRLKVSAAREGKVTTFEALARIDTRVELAYLRSGGILNLQLLPDVKCL